MQNLSKKRKIKSSYFYLAMVLILVASPMIYFFNVNKGYWWDEAVYLGLARNILDGNGYSINGGQESFRPPLFPILIATTWKVFGFSEVVVRMWPIIFSVLTSLATYLFAKKLYNEKIALWSALIVGTIPMFIFFSEKFLTESMFTFFSVLFLLTFYTAIEENKKFLFPVAGVLFSLSFLTRYPAFLLAPVYFLYPIITRKKLDSWLLSYSYWLGIILALVLLVPWFILNQTVYGSPVASLSVQGETVTSEFYTGEWHFYFRHWIEIFGLVGLFVIPGVWKIVLNSKGSDKFLLLVFATLMVFFMFLSRKEQRYLISFIPIFSVIFAYGFHEMRKWFGNSRMFTVLAVFFIFLNSVAGVQAILFDNEGGAALKDAGFYLNEVAPENSRIMTQNMPPIHYASGKQIVYFPQESEKLNETISNGNVSFIVIESREPTYPDWVWEKTGDEKVPSEIFNQFILEKSFQEKGRDIAWVYRV